MNDIIQTMKKAGYGKPKLMETNRGDVVIVFEGVKV